MLRPGPSHTALSLALYALTSLALLAALARVWRQRYVDLPTAWAFTCLVAALAGPHLVDYDLTVLVAAGIIAAPLLPRLAWQLPLLFLLTLLRAQIPMGKLPFS